MTTQVTNSPFIKTFKSPRKFYLYSVNKNAVKEISEDTYNYLENPNSQCFNTELKHLEESGLLAPNPIKKLEHPDSKNLEGILENRLEHLVLQITQACNLTCSYCPYANKTDNHLQRNHSNKFMTFETAKRAIDYFFSHSVDRDKVVISFYGGEPLIGIDLIYKLVEYVKDNYIGKDITFNMTTNATLLTDEIMDFIVNNNFNVVFSIDGPEEIHDINRKKIDGTGSFKEAFTNLKKLISKYKEKNESFEKHISINMVFDPKNDVDLLFELFEDPIFKESFTVMGDVADDMHLENPIEGNDSYAEKMAYQNFLGYLDFFKIVQNLDINPLIKQSFAGRHKEYLQLKKETGKLPEVACPGGPCIPGQHSLFVDIDGKFFPCEKVSELSEVMNIGNLEDGFDIQKAQGLLDISNLTPEKCKNCWALLHCVLCARFADDGETLSKELKNKNCQRTFDYANGLIKEYILFQECKSIYKR